MIARIRQWLAAQRLERITQERRNAFETEQYRRNRRAQRKIHLAREVRVAQRIATIQARWDRFDRQRQESMG